MYEELKDMSVQELVILQNEISSVLDERRLEEEKEARQEMLTVLDKWAEHSISFYIYDNEDNKITIYPRELCVERGWI